MKTHKKRLLVIAVIMGFVLIVCSITTSIWNTYGGHNIRMAVAQYVEVNDGRWPQSWEDIEEYHSDPLLSCHSTVFVKRYWTVAWDIKPQDFISVSSRKNSDIESVPVVFNKKRVTDSGSVKYWDLGKRITEYYQNKKQAEQGAAGNPLPAE